MSPKEVARRGGDDVVMRVDVSSLTTLDLKDIEHETEAALVARGAAYAREYARIEDKPAILAANIATVILALRKAHDDWRGLTKPYRDRVSALYESSGVTGEQLSRLKANVRYHVGNQARRYLTPRELRALELDDASPLEKQRDRRATNSAILRATGASVEAASSAPVKTVEANSKTKGKARDEERVPDQRGPGLVVKATADHLRLAHVARGLVEQLDEDVLSDMAAGQRAKLDEELAAVESAARRLRRLLKKSRSEA
jgi:hypothetical protein